MLSREQVLHVARLARLQLSDDEVERLGGELSKVVDWIDKIGELGDLEGVPPTSHVVAVENALREDVPHESLPREAALASAPDPDRVADLLLALGFEAVSHWPRRVFRDGAGVGITLQPVGEPDPAAGASWSMSWEEAPDEATTSLALALPAPELAHHRLDDVAVMVVPDRRPRA